MKRFSEMIDDDLQYAAVNDRVSRQAAYKTLDLKDLMKKGYRSFNYADTDEEEMDDYYGYTKRHAVEIFKFIEDKLGRSLTDQEMINIFDIFDVTTSGFYCLEKVEDESSPIDNYDERGAEEFINNIDYIVKSIEYGILQELHDRVLEKTEKSSPNYEVDSTYKEMYFDIYVIPAFNEIMEEKYGVPEKKEGDDLPPPEQEKLSKEDELNLEDFEEVYDDD